VTDDHKSTGTDTGDGSRARLLLDTMLGKLATYLRMCGYDAAYALGRDVEADSALLAIARDEGRTLVTRDRQLAARAPDSALLENRDVTDQLRELRAAGYELSLDDSPTFCGQCNGTLDRVAGDDSVPDYAPDPTGTDVWRCRDCGQHFWKGSHWDDVAAILDAL